MVPLPFVLDHVLAGRTIHGRPADHGVIALPRALIMAQAYLCIGHFIIPSIKSKVHPSEVEATATRLLVSGAHYLIRVGSHGLDETTLASDAGHAATAIEHATPQALTTQSYGWFVRTGRERASQTENNREVHKSVLTGFRERHLRAPAPLAPPDVVWRHRHHTLVSLRDPVQIFDEGIRLNNCLATHFMESLTPQSSYPAALDRLIYANRVAKHGWQVLSLRQGAERIGVFALAASTVNKGTTPRAREVQFGPDFYPRRDRTVLDAAKAWANATYATGQLPPTAPLPPMPTEFSIPAFRLWFSRRSSS